MWSRRHLGDDHDATALLRGLARGHLAPQRGEGLTHDVELAGHRLEPGLRVLSSNPRSTSMRTNSSV
ncbi:MAG TPA: hypothetical protein VGB19_06285 [Actinomycetota bacterium]